ncbi:hypothetical protein SPRG_03553 [Saprolegnia parasitica CBS 223.65]|uniref:Uncharacterized protein n=1 Tax=Saprolegnia parasitica (strain CBS 223.65) TaxID=695850 RepID=A0A067CMA3_SAPPC|nr:hypothetical protein SPRG_03553 [Saprolegnia parasitica CBS 223.65]KDO31633.1 hypothetical protein SPRG_03553 [Saprolegnia parasitica CBS 223.65]|eukprot:XP_012197523.1 hypothetical protein SPRG_03553 [Saprolegnia parasitica CBS 223.65]
MAAARTDLYYVPESLKREFSTHELAEFLDQFKAFDTSGDGGIDVNELSTMMASMNVHMERTELLQLIAAVDENNSGQIEFTEFVRMMSNLRRGKANKLGRFMQLAKQAFEIRREFTATVTTPIPGCVIEPFPKDMRQWHVHIAGPETSPYAGGRFTFHFEFGHEYPYEAPSVRLLTRVYHLNFIVLVDGSASAECLTQLWNPDWRSRDLIERIQALLLAPDPALMEPLYNSAEARLELQGLRYAGTTVRSFGLDCLRLFHNDYEAYCKHARDTTAKHAMRAVPPS